MNPFDWIKAAPWIACVVLALALAGMTGKYLNKRDELVRLEASVRVLGEQAERDLAAKEKEGKANLEKVKVDHEKELPRVRRDAVANYRARPAAEPARVRDAVAGGGTVPADAPSQPMDDGAGKECGLDEAFIADAAEDAEKVETWRAWCILNHCPVE